ncbi:hypothetical protein EJK50_0027 [Moraxella catarrhalis]|nr:hypothetical protein EJK50_0027 [Moraxella catarrhalis]
MKENPEQAAASAKFLSDLCGREAPTPPIAFHLIFSKRPVRS